MKKFLSAVSIVLSVSILMSLGGCAISSRRRAENDGSSSRSTRDKKNKDDGEDYLSKAKQLDDDTLSDIQSSATASFKDDAAGWDTGEELESLTYVGNYLLVTKDEDETDEHNILFVIYKVRIRNIDTSGDQTFEEVHDYFWYVRYDDLTIDEDDNVEYDKKNFETPDDKVTFYSDISRTTWTYSGYPDLDDLYDAVIAEYEEDFKCTDNIDMSLTAGPTNTPTPSPTPTPNPADYEPYQMKSIDITASAYYIQGEGTSSEKPHYPSYAADDDMKTAWNVRAHVENGEKVTTRGVGEWIEFSFAPGTYMKTVVIHPGFVYGSGDSVHRFERNYAPTKLLITAGGQSFEVDLGDYAYDVEKALSGYEFEFPEWVRLTDGKIRITILESRNIYAEKGYDGPWDDCCISEIKFWGIDPID